jgi:hypothetical protein
MGWIVRTLALAALLGSVACSSDEPPDGGSGTPDAGTAPAMDATVSDSGASAPDARVDAGVMPRDAGPPDTGPVYDYGTRLASSPADIVGVTPDESAVIYRRSIQGRESVYAIAPEGGAARAIVTAPGHSVITRTDPSYLGVATTGPVVWMFTNMLRSIGESGRIRAWRPGSAGEAITVTGTSARGIIAVSDDGEWIVATEAYTRDGPIATATRSADLVIANADGEVFDLGLRVNVGQFESEEFLGRCEPNLTWTSSRTAAAVVCVGESETPDLYVIDVGTRTATVVERGVISYLQANPEGTFFFWADEDVRIHASAPDGSNRLRLVDTSTVRAIRFLDHRRFVFNNADLEMKVAAYPDMVPTTVQDFAVNTLRRVSPTGDYVMFSDSPDFIATLAGIETTTTAGAVMAELLEDRATAYPGDDAWTPDGERMFWYVETNPNLIGDVVTRRTMGGMIRPLASQVYWVYNYANPERVVLLMNAVEIRTNVITADLATRNLDGSGPLEIIAGGLLVQPRDFVLFPRTRRIVFHIPDGPNSGLWVRDLP